MRVTSGKGSRKEVEILPVRGLGMRVLQEIVAFVLVHYIFWILPVWLLACALWASHPSVGPAVTAVCAAVYGRSFFDGSEKKCGRPWEGFRKSSVWHLLHSYFPSRVVRTVELDVSKQYIMGWHPHGILVLSRIFCYGGVWEHLFEGLDFRVLGATPMFFVPFCRDICLWMRAVDASRQTTEYNLEKGRTVIVYPGGSKEIFETDGNKPDTIVYVRSGFIRMALKYGCDLVPVYVFGEKHCYYRWSPPELVRGFFLKTLKIPLIIFWGRFFTWMPFRTPQVVVFGAPVPVQKVDNPTDDQVNALHATYCAALQALYQEHKSEAGYAKNEMLIIR